jgi:hypothetical protein
MILRKKCINSWYFKIKTHKHSAKRNNKGLFRKQNDDNDLKKKRTVISDELLTPNGRKGHPTDA